MNFPLYPHQNTGVIRLASKTPTYLGFDMGIGKSRTFIEAAKVSGGARFLILCPKSAVMVWQREIALWEPNASYVVARRIDDLKPGPRYTIVTHGLLSQREGDIARYLALTVPFDMTAIDEAANFNSATALRVKALRRAVRKLGFIVPLSGTPMKNHAGDLYTLLSICWPEGLKTGSGSYMTRFDYEEQFCRVALKRFGGREVRVIEGSKNIPALRARLAPFMFRVRKEDVLTDLPPIKWDLVPVDPDPSYMPQEDADELRVLVSEIVARTANGKDVTSTDAAALALSAAGGGHLMALRRKLGLAKLRGACEYLVDMLDNLPPSRKVLVFAVHKDVVASLEHHLQEYDPAVITGDVSEQGRAVAYKKFLTEPSCRVFVGNIQAAGTALTLVGPTCKCSDVVFVESSWTPMDNAQAACRVHRIGQHDGVMARMLTAAGTIDDLIQGILARKASDFTSLFDTKGENA